MLSRLKEFAFLDEVIRRPPLLYQYFRHLLTRSELWGPSEREAWLNTRVARTLAAARTFSGYSKTSQSDNLSDWPVLKKDDVIGREMSFGRSGLLPNYFAATGGTTGQPLRVARSLTSICLETAVLDHICAKVGLDLRRARVAVLRGDFVKQPSDITPPFWRSTSPRRRVFSSFHLTSKTLKSYLTGLREYNPDVLFCYPSSLQHLLALLKERRDEIHIAYVLASSERFPADLVATAQQVLGSRIIDYYGQAERVVIAYAFDGGGYYFVPVYGRPELIPDNSQRARILGTSFWNSRQVFVRYDTGDVAQIPGNSTLREIELGVQPFGGIEGRTNERIDLPEGQRIIGLNHIPRGVPGVASLQLYHRAPRIVEAFVVPLEDYGAQTETIIRRNFYEKFPADIELQISKIDTPVRIASGKAPLLLSAAP